jgi:hypothetical protein
MLVLPVCGDEARRLFIILIRRVYEIKRITQIAQTPRLVGSRR